MLELDFNDEEINTLRSKNIQIIECEQNSEQWFQARIGRITASNMHTLMGNGKTRDGILLNKAAEIITGNIDQTQSFSNDQTQRGHELEQEAINAYAEKNKTEVKQVGFVVLDDFVGVSPDGLIGEHGLVEIKCPNNKNYLDQIISDKRSISQQYITQMQMQMYVCERQWCDYTIYNPNFENSLHTIRLNRDENYINHIKQEIERAKKQIAGYLKRYASA